MTKEIFYKKVGRKYVPVSEYDSDLSYALPKGAHLLIVYPGGQSTRYNVNPNYAAMIAAGRICEDVISKKIMEATELRRHTRNAEQVRQMLFMRKPNEPGREAYPDKPGTVLQIQTFK